MRGKSEKLTINDLEWRVANGELRKNASQFSHLPHNSSYVRNDKDLLGVFIFLIMNLFLLAIIEFNYSL